MVRLVVTCPVLRFYLPSPASAGKVFCGSMFCGSAVRCSLTVGTSAARSSLKVWPCRTDVDAPAVPHALNPGADSIRAQPTQTTDLRARQNADPPHRERDGSLSRCIGSERTRPSSVTIDGFDGGFKVVAQIRITPFCSLMWIARGRPNRALRFAPASTNTASTAEPRTLRICACDRAFFPRAG